MENDKLVRTSDVETELLRATERYTVAHEARGTGTVVWSDNLVSVSNALNAVRSIPAVDAVEVVHGIWVKMDMHRGMENYKCSVCRSECYVPETMGEPMFPLCPYCGSRMDGRREEEHNAAD